jgi:uncharacterized tellurite resistance protein B-like protein
MMRTGGRGGIRVKTSSGRSTAVVMSAGLALYVLGYAGVFVGRIIQAAVCRQREFLADASAVQYTRQTEGLAGALRKIAGLGRQSFMRASRAEEVSHMLFAAGRRFIAGLFATHPPIEARLEALGVAAAEPVTAATASPAPAASHGFASLTPQAVTSAVGNPGAPQLEFAARLEATLPVGIPAAARALDGAVPLTLALLLDGATQVRRHQLSLIEVRYGPLVSKATRELASTLAGVSESLYLSVLDLTFPVLRTMSESRRHYLLDTVERMIQVDGRVDAFEAAVAEALRVRLDDLTGDDERKPLPLREAAAPAVTIIAALALIGHRGQAEAGKAFRDGLAALGELGPATVPPLAEVRPDSAAVRSALRALDALSPAHKKMMVHALATAAASDGAITGREAEILRAVCGTLHCPLPPVVRRPESATGASPSA